MRLPVLAFFSRSLRIDTRRIRSYLARLLPLGLILCFLMQIHSSMEDLGAPGLAFFQSIIYLNFFVIALIGMISFASAITEEKESMTLGLLRMTGIGSGSILFGKSASRTLTAIMILFAQLPFTLLAISLGGVSLLQIFAAYCTLASYIVFLSGLALCCSVLCKRSSNAAGVTGLMLLGFFLLPPLVLYAVRGLPFPVPPLTTLQQLLDDPLAAPFLLMREASAFKRIAEVMATGFAGSAAYNFQVLSNLALGGIFFGLSWCFFALLSGEQKEATPARGLTPRRTSVLWRLGVGRAWSQALIWKDFHFVARGWVMMIAKFIFYPALCAFVIYMHYRLGQPGRLMSLRAIDWESVGVWIMVLTLIITFIELVLHAGNLFNTEMRWGTLPGIMVLPMSTAWLAYSKVAGCLISVLPTTLIFFMLGAVLAPEAIGNTLAEPRAWKGIANTVAWAVFFLHLVAYLSLIVKHGATLLALAICLVGGWFLILLLSFLFRFVPPPVLVLLLPVLITAFLHIGIGRRLRKVAGH